MLKEGAPTSVSMSIWALETKVEEDSSKVDGHFQSLQKEIPQKLLTFLSLMNSQVLQS